MLQIKGNICAWEVVPARSEHSRYTIPHFLAFHPQENSGKLCDKERERACKRERERECYESLWMYSSLQVSFCAGSPHIMQAAAAMGTGVEEAGEQGAALHPEKLTLPPTPSAGA